MVDKWTIKVSAEYESRETAIREFEGLIARLKSNNYSRGSGGNSAASYFVSGPNEHPLTNIEIAKIRAIIS